jgi:RimJ/RimL family protein N-acetyltransferase
MSTNAFRIVDPGLLPMVVEPVTLEGHDIRLEPLSLHHHAQLCEAGLDDEVWRWIPQAVRTPDEMRAYIETAIEWQAAGTAFPFAIVGRSTGRAIGSTRFGNIDRANRRVEIGWTWLGKNWQRTAANTETNYLMLRHAFEIWRCLRVEYKTDSFNQRARAALLRLGTKEEGIFRNHVVTWTGRIRHSVYYSIIDSEWPDVRADLEKKLSRE